MSAAASMKFDFSQVTTTRDDGPQMFLLYSEEKWGKTTLICTVPGLFIIVPEEGLKGIDHPAAHFPRSPRNLAELYEALDVFERNNVRDQSGKRPFRHLALDSTSWIETMIHQAARADIKSRNLGEDYQSGHKIVDARWDEFVERITTLRRRSGVHVWLLAHAHKVKEVAMTGETYDKYDLRLEPKAAALLRSRADHVFFGVYRSKVVKGGKGKRTIGQYVGRVIFTRSSAHHFAGSRSGVPEVVNATWADLLAALQAGAPAPSAKLRADIEAIMPRLQDAERAAIAADLAEAKTERDLTRVLSRAEGYAALLDENDGEDEAPANDDGQAPGAPPPDAPAPESGSRVAQAPAAAPPPPPPVDDDEDAGPAPLDASPAAAPTPASAQQQSVLARPGDEDDVEAQGLVEKVTDLESISRAKARIYKLPRLTETTRAARMRQLDDKRAALLARTGQ